MERRIISFMPSGASVVTNHAVAEVRRVTTLAPPESIPRDFTALMSLFAPPGRSVEFSSTSA